MNSDFHNLVERRRKAVTRYEKSLDESKYLFQQVSSQEQDLLNFFYTQENVNPTKIVSRSLSSLPPQEEEGIRIALGDRLLTVLSRRIVNDTLGYKMGFSASWASRIFNRALQKLRHPSRGRKLRKMRDNNAQFLEMTGIDKEVLEDYLTKHFYLETNLFCWLFGEHNLF